MGVVLVDASGASLVSVGEITGLALALGTACLLTCGTPALGCLAAPLPLATYQWVEVIHLQNRNDARQNTLYVKAEYSKSPPLDVGTLRIILLSSRRLQIL